MTGLVFSACTKTAGDLNVFRATTGQTVGATGLSRTTAARRAPFGRRGD
ncbi:hypothetical protein [Pseudooceanicola nanhaiensis]